MVHALLIAALLAGAETSTPVPTTTEVPAAGPTAPGSPIPDEEVVLGLRLARIARDAGDVTSEGAILDELASKRPSDPTVVAAALSYHRRRDPASATTHELQTRLLEALSRPGSDLPDPLLAAVADDPLSTPAELARLADILRDHAGEGPKRIRRLELRIDLLERLGREEERISELESLASVDGDPAKAWTLLEAYRKAKRWDGVLRVLERMPPNTAWPGAEWLRLEGLAALGRMDELQKQAGALMERFRGQLVPASGPVELSSTPTALRAAAFYPTIFRLVDAGRAEAARTLMAHLVEASKDDPGVKRAQVLLFGSAAERSAFLAAELDASLASSNPEGIRADADRRLLAKDFAGASGLFKRAHELKPEAFDNDVYFWFNYGLSLIETAQWPDAEAAMSRVLAVDPKNARALAHRGRARIMQKRFAEGIKDAEDALAIDPACRQACYALYLAYETLGEKTKAAEWLARFQGK